MVHFKIGLRLLCTACLPAVTRDFPTPAILHCYCEWLTVCYKAYRIYK